MLYKEMTSPLREAKQRLESDVMTIFSTFEKEREDSHDYHNEGA